MAAHDPALDVGARSHVVAYQLVHRRLLTELARVTDGVGQLATTGPAEMFADNVRSLLARLEATLSAIDDHCRWEDRVLWPMIAAAAGAAVDVRPLLADHSEVQVRLRSVEAAADALRHEPPEAPALIALRSRLHDLHDVLSEHIGEEERDVVPVLMAYVAVEDYQQARRGIPTAEVAEATA